MNGGDFSLSDIIWAATAMIGGIAKYLDAYIRGGEHPSWCKLIANAFVSGFSGYMVAKGVISFKPEWGTIAAGVGGYMGTQAIDWLAAMLRSLLVPNNTPNAEVKKADEQPFKLDDAV